MIWYIVPKALFLKENICNYVTQDIKTVIEMREPYENCLNDATI